MDDAALLDYFRYEFVGKIVQLTKERTESETRLWAEIKRLSDAVDKLTRELHEVKARI